MMMMLVLLDLYSDITDRHVTDHSNTTGVMSGTKPVTFHSFLTTYSYIRQFNILTNQTAVLDV